jgi:hypothetical protein
MPRSDAPPAAPSNWPTVAIVSTMPTAKIAWPSSSSRTLTISGAMNTPRMPPARKPMNAARPMMKPCR